MSASSEYILRQFGPASKYSGYPDSKEKTDFGYKLKKAATTCGVCEGSATSQRARNEGSVSVAPPRSAKIATANLG